MFWFPIPFTHLICKFCPSWSPNCPSSAIQLRQLSPVELSRSRKHSCLLVLPTPEPATPGSLLRSGPIPSSGLQLLGLPQYCLHHSTSVMCPCCLSGIPPSVPSPHWSPWGLVSCSSFLTPQFPSCGLNYRHLTSSLG